MLVLNEYGDKEMHFSEEGLQDGDSDTEPGAQLSDNDSGRRHLNSRLKSMGLLPKAGERVGLLSQVACTDLHSHP